MIRAAILSLAFLMAGVGSVSAGECGKLCDTFWRWGKPTQEEITAELATVKATARDEYGDTPLLYTATLGTPANIVKFHKIILFLTPSFDQYLCVCDLPHSDMRQHM